MAKKTKGDPPQEVRAIREKINAVLNMQDNSGNQVGNSKYGVYAFYDYDGEPIYVGQTEEKLRTRIRRHLTNQRTDAVAMNVLDPFEVAEIEMWPLWNLQGKNKNKIKKTLNQAEYTVYKKLIKSSLFHAILNEKPIAVTAIISLPKSVKGSIVPEPVYSRRKHPDLRIARRATTIAKLAQVISERSVQPGLRQTFLIQARRLEHLSRKRLEETSEEKARKKKKRK